MRVYDARAGGSGAPLGVVWPESAEVQEEAGGEYILRLSVPVAKDAGWELMAPENLLSALCPVLGGKKLQLFRIHSVSVEDGGTKLSVQARHISYDLQYLTVTQARVHDAPIAIGTACAELWQDIMGDPGGFTLETAVEGTLMPSWGQGSVIKALLDQSTGLVRMARARLVRDNRVVYFLPSNDLDSGVTIRHGVDLLGLNAGTDMTSCYTRLIPTGLDENGGIVMLPEDSVLSPMAGQYALDRAYTWQVTGARVGTKRTLEDGTQEVLDLEGVYAMLRQAALEKLDAGCDRPESTGTVEYIDLGRTAQYPELEGLQKVRLYQQVGIEHRPMGLMLRKTVCGYTWDALHYRYTQLRLGDPFADGGLTSYVTSSQRAADAANARVTEHYTQTRLEDHAEFEREQVRYNNSVLIDLDAVKGEIKLLATSAQVDTLATRINQAEIDIDGAEAAIALKASSESVNELEQSFSLARVDIDALQAEIRLKASQTSVDDLEQAVTQAEIDINGLDAEIQLKASQTTVNALGERVSKAEIAIDGANSLITLKANKVDLDGYVTLKAFEALEGTVNSIFTDFVATGSISANYVIAGNGDFDILTFGQCPALDDYATKEWVTENFPKASVITLDQTWSGGRLTISTTTVKVTLSGETTAAANSAPQNLAWNGTKATFDVTCDRGTIVSGMQVDATGVYNTGWNACRDACSYASNVYTISENAPGTLYMQVNGNYTSVGSSWVKVTAKTGLYYRPSAK